MGPKSIALLVIAGLAAGASLIVRSPAEPPGAPAGPSPSLREVSVTYPNPDSAAFNFRGYVWPTDASRKITSSFAEYRSLHFHGGIDISTGGTVGHKVFAVQDGYLYRIRITPNGYGKMLYLRHPDGYISTYAHLQSFNGRIAELARAEQYRTGSYEIDLIHDIPATRVRKGEVIAYTGDTGFGPPHLHFEIRDSGLNPVNPLLGETFRTPDNIPPTISRFMARPLDAASTVNGRGDIRFWSRFPRKNGVYRIPGKILVDGTIGLAVETKDRSNGVGGRTGVYTVELLVDGALTFRSSLNAVPILKTKQIYIHYDLPTILEGRGKLQKLYVEPGNELPLYAGTPDDGGIIRTDRLEEGDHEFTVRCTDIEGNASVLTGTLSVSHPPAVQIVSATPGSVGIVSRSRAPIDEVSVQGSRLPGSSWTGHTLTGARLGKSGDTILVPVDAKAYDILKVTARAARGPWSAPAFHILRKRQGPAQPVSIDHESVGGELRIGLATKGAFTDVPEVSVVEGDRAVRVPMTLTDLSRAEGRYTLPSGNARGLTIRASGEVNARAVTSEKRVEIYSIPDDRPGAFARADRGFAVSYDSGAVFSPLHFTVSKKEESGRTVYGFEPRDILLNRGITVSLPLPEGTAGRPGLYYRAKSGWVLLDAPRGSQPDKISGRLTTMLGDLAVMGDGAGPTVGLLRVRTSGGRVTFSFRYHDDLSGVDLEKSMMTVDGETVIPEIDGEHRRIRYTGDDRLAKGRHLLRIALVDRAGNRSVVERAFSVR